MSGALKAAPWLLLLILGGFAKCTYDGRRRAEGREAVQQAQIAEQRDSLRTLRDSLARAYRVDTVRLTRTLVRRDTVLATVDRWLHDTVAVPVEVVREIVRADSAVIEACRVALSTCEQEKAALAADLTLIQRQADYWRGKAAPSLITRLSTAAKWLAIGYGVAAVTRR